MHAPHAVAVCIARTRLGVDFSYTDVHELGRWSHESFGDGDSSAVQGVGNSMPIRYSSGETALLKEAELRRRACKVVQDVIGQRSWRVALPFQRGERPSYGFLSGVDDGGIPDRPAAEGADHGSS
jgi:hypothetical protein